MAAVVIVAAILGLAAIEPLALVGGGLVALGICGWFVGADSRDQVDRHLTE